MLKLALRLLVLALVLLAALQVNLRGKSGAANADSPPNLAPNPSFELAQQTGKLETTAIAGWHFVPFSGPGESPNTDAGVWDATTAHSGSHSVNLKSTPISLFQGNTFCIVSNFSSGSWESDAFPVSSSTTGYSVSFWLRTSSLSLSANAPIVIQMSFFDAQGQDIGLQGAAPGGAPDATSSDQLWNKWTVQVSAGLPYVGPTVTAARLRLMQSASFPGPCPASLTTWIDDISASAGQGTFSSLVITMNAAQSVRCGESIPVLVNAFLITFFPQAVPDGTAIVLSASRGTLSPATVTTTSGSAQLIYTAPSTGGIVTIGVLAPPTYFGSPTLSINITCATSELACLDPSRGDTVSTWHWNASISPIPRSGDMTVTKTVGATPGTSSVSIAGLLDYTFTGRLISDGGSGVMISTYAGPTGSDIFFFGNAYNSTSLINGFMSGVPLSGGGPVSATLTSCMPLNGKVPGPTTYAPTPPGQPILDPPVITVPGPNSTKGL